MKRSFWWKKSCYLKIRVLEVLLCFKDKESDEKVLVFCKDKTSNESTSLCLKLSDISVFYETLSFMTMKVIIFYDEEFMKRSFVIL